MPLTLTSTDFDDGDYLAPAHLLSEPFGFGCAGGNVSPAFAWADPPTGTASFALTCFDPDAPTGSGFWHWIVVDLAADVRALAEDAGNDALPGGARHLTNDFGTDGYGGPCPPAGDHPHRYLFTVHALSVPRLPVDHDAPGAVARFLLNANTLATAALVGLCRR